MVEFIQNYTSVSLEFPISQHTALVEDIGLDGDDADEFMLAYSKRFSVDAGDFQFPDYFDRKGFDLIETVMDVIRQKPSLKPLTIGMPELAAKMGRWDTKTLDEAYSKKVTLRESVDLRPDAYEFAKGEPLTLLNGGNFIRRYVLSETPLNSAGINLA